MRTKLKLGPADHGRRVPFEEFLEADFVQGWHYQYIQGRVDVAPMPDPPADHLENWLLDQLKAYAVWHPQVINKVTAKGAVYVAGRDDVSYPEPDIAAYHDYPTGRRVPQKWHEVNPVLVVEVLTPSHAEKDTVRNVEVYLEVPTIKEYWIVDPRERPGEVSPRLIVHRRHGRAWRVTEVPYGGTYTTKLLPGFVLLFDPYNETAGQ